MDLVTFTEEIPNGKLHFLCNGIWLFYCSYFENKKLLLAKVICLEFHKGDTSSSAIAASSGVSVLWNFDQVAKK